MILEEISIVNYKNIEQADLQFSPNVNCFVGSNGMGKTNVLDTIHYLSFCKSAGGPSDHLNIRHEADFFMIKGVYRNEAGGSDTVSLAVQRGGRKRLRRNDKDYRRFSEHVGLIPLVMISPSDSALVQGGSEERRKFMDAVISQYNTAYLESLIRYERTLKQRNALLKQEAEPDGGVFEVIEDMMAMDAAVIFEERCKFVEEFVPVFRELYNKLCNTENEEVGITYESHGFRGDLKPLLSDWRERERIVGHTLHGVHRDELQLDFNGYPVRREGSQGQTKTYFIAMKLAQFLFLRLKGACRAPILLLDDIFDKLDSGRVARIVDYVSGSEFGQIFITDTNRRHLDLILETTCREYRLFAVRDGVIYPDC